MSAKVYLLGTIHRLPIDRIIKDIEGFRKLLAEIEIVVMEAPQLKPTLKTKLKAPALYTGLFIYHIFMRIAKTTSNVILKKGKGDSESFMLFISQKVKRSLNKIEKQQLKSRESCDDSSISIVSCYDADLNKDIAQKGLGYVLLNYIAFIFCLLLFLYGLGSIILNKSNIISYFLILFSIGIPFCFFSDYVEKNMSERNNIAVDYCKEVITKKYEKILLFYGNNHIEDINQKLKKSGIETEIIQVKKSKLLKYVSKSNIKNT